MPGTLVGYDDWAAGGAQGGEQQAHREWAARRGVRLRTLAGLNSRQRIFEVL